MAAKKFIVYRKGGQVGASVYSDFSHRESCLETARKTSPFIEEVFDGKTPIGLMVFNPMRTEVEKSEPNDWFDPSTLKDSDVPKSANIFAPPPKEE